MPELSFEELAQLRLRRSAKWQAFGPDVIPAWVAEMDFAMAPPIAAALHAAIDRSDTGYAWPQAVGEALSVFGATRWGWLVDPANVIPVADVLTGVGQTLIALTQPGEAVVINSPVYPPFFTTVAHVAHRTVVDVPLVWNGARHVLDLAGLAREFSRPEVTAYLLCSPQNPTGLVFSRADLEFIAQLAAEHGVMVVADEIHAPMTHPGVEFWPYLAVSGDRPAVSVISASKAWNIAGLKCAQIVTNDAELTARLRTQIPLETQHGAGHLGALAAIVAYTEGQPWLDSLVEHLRKQAELLSELLVMHLPLVRCEKPMASYLAWLDCRPLDLGKDPAAYFLEHARVALNSGPTFGPSGAGFVRLNFACSPELLIEIVTRMGAALR
ncbi:MAG: aminotransferase class I/II-fold pyridoxal phosphate-dependent enzyme [Actinomycetota bacterium]|nr:aminotransferase class I/II-fold pyridoxal phosphate-dependent enzyme [Actinomycetota bacterium]